LSEVLEAQKDGQTDSRDMSERRKLLKVQRFCLMQKLCDWLDTQVRARIDDNTGLVEFYALRS